MGKSRIATYMLLLLLSLAAATSMLDVKSANALKVSVQWGYLAEGSPPGEVDAEE